MADGEDLDRALDALLRMEASGWKGREGTAMLDDPPLERLYRAFVARAARRGWLRLYVLELDGRAVAADLHCSFSGQGFLLKTAFDEDHAALSPGLVLRADVLRASIEEGLRGYDFLGGSEPYKLRWASEVRQRITLMAFRGPSTIAERACWSHVHPAAKRAHALARAAGARARRIAAGRPGRLTLRRGRDA